MSVAELKRKLRNSPFASLQVRITGPSTTRLTAAATPSAAPAYSVGVSAFPATRLRRLRRTDALSALVRETRLDLDDFVLPLFAGPSTVRNEELPAMSRYSVDDLVAEAGELAGARRQGAAPLRRPRGEGRRGVGRLDRGRDRAAGAAGPARRAPRARADHRRLPLRVHVARPLRRHPRRRGRERRDARAAGAHRGQPRRGRRGRRRAERHDGRPRRRDPRGRCRRRRSSPTPPSTPPRSTGPSATSPSRRRRSATGAATRWIRPTCARRCASASSTSPRAPTC